MAEPFGLGEARSYDLVRIAADHGAALHLAGVQAVEPDRRQILTWDGRTLDFDVLLLAIGARSDTSIPGSVTIAGPGYTSRFRTVLRELEERRIRRVAFAVPPGASWPLPLYELALMTATRVAERGLRKVELSLVTPEEAPLEIFGARASRAVADLLMERGVGLHTARHPAEFRDGELRFIPSGGVAAERVISLPRLLGPEIPGIPHDAQGFIPVDLHGLVQGELDIYAAGDATTCPIKQGGVAHPAGGCRGRGDRRPSRRRDRAEGVPAGPPRSAAHGFDAPLHAGRGERRARRGLGRLRARALVAAQQGRGPLARPLPRATSRGARGRARRASGRGELRLPVDKATRDHRAEHRQEGGPMTAL